MRKPSVLIYVFADQQYEMFVLPYLFFSLLSNREAHVEVVLGNPGSLLLNDNESVNALRKLFGNRFLIRKSNFPENISATPNVRRFLEQPESNADYVYIGDIDIMLLDDVKRVHVDILNKNNIPFSNVIRNPGDKKKRLTGLHFVRYEDMYPLPDITDLDLLRNNDEHVLYLIMQRKGYMVPDDFKERPELGIHMSLSRDPMGRTSGPRQSIFTQPSIGWGGERYYKRYMEVVESYEYKEVERFFDIRFRLFSLMVQAMATDQYHELETFGLGYLIDRSKLINSKYYKLKDVLSKDKVSLEERLAFPLRKEVFFG